MKLYSHKQCRRYGIKLCQSVKCPVQTRKYPPGVHGPKGYGRRMSGYANQLAEKQKAKILYNLREGQFRKYYEEAVSKQGDTGEILVKFLELRLDNAVYRAGLAPTRAAARQLVNHGMVTVNGKKVNIPSFRVKVKDEIGIKENKDITKMDTNIEKRLEKMEFPSWIAVDAKEKTAKITGMPKPADAEQAFNPRQIVELYTK